MRTLKVLLRCGDAAKWLTTDFISFIQGLFDVGLCTYSVAPHHLRTPTASLSGRLRAPATFCVTYDGSWGAHAQSPRQPQPTNGVKQHRAEANAIPANVFHTNVAYNGATPCLWPCADRQGACNFGRNHLPHVPLSYTDGCDTDNIRRTWRANADLLLRAAECAHGAAILDTLGVA